MKRFLSLSIIALLFVSYFTACKKGDNDPFSLRSRKARLTGVWILKNVDLKETEVNNGNIDITTYSYDGATMTVTEDGEGETTTYSETIEVKKDGTFTQEQLVQAGYVTFKIKISGVWSFVYGNKENKIKNKERIQFIAEKRTETYNGNIEEITFEGISQYLNNANNYLLDRLSNKELVFRFDAEKTETYTNNAHNSSLKIEGTKTYEKK